MKLILRIALAALLFVTSAVTSFAFEWISLSEPDAEMSLSFSAGYGNLIFVPVSILPIGARFEMVIPGVENLYAGAGVGYLGIEWDDDGDLYDYSLNYVSTGVYAKYIIFDRPTMEEMISLPMYVGAAAGIGYQFGLDDYHGYDLSSTYGGIGGLAVALVGYEFDKFTITAYGGLVDREFNWSAEFHWRLNESMHLGLFWVPLIGLGGTFTMAL